MSFVEIDGVAVPQAPATPEEADVEIGVLTDLVLKLAYTASYFTTESAAAGLCLPLNLVATILDQLRFEKLVDILGPAGPFSYRFTITDYGREHAQRLLRVSGYVGPAPVSLATYTALLDWQFAHRPEVSPREVAEALSDLVLPDDALRVAGLAGSSGRSLFVYGPPGNGKTTLGHLLHRAIGGELWIPHCIAVDRTVIRLFDPHCHEPAPATSISASGPLDRRWLRVRRPFVVVGGELTLDGLDLGYSAARGDYEAPLHLKANGGTFLLDDFGRQRIEARQLLNRWIYPLEHGVDHLTLQTGQKITVPFRQLLVVCTNLSPSEVMDSALLRRMGYRLFLGDPSPERYTRIFERHAARSGATVPAGTVERLLARYAAEGRPLRSCEPRDLIDRARDVCRFAGRPLALSEEALDLAWTGYFGERHALGWETAASSERPGRP